MEKRSIIAKVLLYELCGFASIVFFLWVNEVLDVPHLVFNAPSTPVNFAESVFETVLIILLTIPVIVTTYSLLKRIKYLEGFLPVCACCRKIRVAEEWIELESFLSEHSEAILSHSMCPDCVREYYGV